MVSESRISVQDKLKKITLQRQVDQNSFVAIVFGYVLIIGFIQFIAMLFGKGFSVQSALIVLPILAGLVFTYYTLIAKGTSAAFDFGSGGLFNGKVLVLLTIFVLLVLTAIFWKDVMPILAITSFP